MKESTNEESRITLVSGLSDLEGGFAIHCGGETKRGRLGVKIKELRLERLPSKGLLDI